MNEVPTPEAFDDYEPAGPSIGGLLTFTGALLVLALGGYVYLRGMVPR